MRFIVTILILLFSSFAQAQKDSSFRLVGRYPVSAADAQIDNLGNLYLVSEEGQVKKLSPQGDSLAVFNGVRRFGKLTSIDVSNPLKVLLFYKDFAQVVVLDRFLAQQFTIDLRRQGIQQPVAAALSFDNKVWVFDAWSNQLKKLDDGGNLLLETPDLRAIFPGGLRPVEILDQNNWVYLHDTTNGLFVFDYYGNFKRKVPVAGWQSLIVTDQFVYGITAGFLNSYNLGNLMQANTPLPTAIQPCSWVQLTKERLVAFCPNGLSLFSLPWKKQR